MMTRHRGFPGSQHGAAVSWLAVMLGLAVSTGTLHAAPGDDVDTWRDLQLVVWVESDTSDGDAPVHLAASLRNVGTEELPIFLSWDRKPLQWSIESSDGRRFTVAPFRGQTTSLGPDDGGPELAGHLIRFGPGEERRLDELGLFEEVVDIDGVATPLRYKPLPLDPGRYVVSATYEQATEEVPLDDSFAEILPEISDADSIDASSPSRPSPSPRPTHHLIDGLWTGRIAAEPVLLEVLPTGEPMLRIDGPATVEIGEPLPLRVTLSHPGDDELVVPGWLELHSTSLVSHTMVRLRPDGLPMPEGDATVSTFRLAPGAEQDLVIDLEALSWTHTSRRNDTPRPSHLYQVSPGGEIPLQLQVVGADEKPVLASNVLYPVVTPRLPRAGEPIELRCAVSSNGGRVPAVDVTISNAGRHGLVVPRPLFSRDVYLALVDIDRPDQAFAHCVNWEGRSHPGRDALIPRGLAWDGAAGSERAQMTPEDFRDLSPGGSLVMTLRLEELIRGRLPKGRYRLTAYWRNVESGRRLGLGRDPGGPKAAHVGLAAAPPIDISVTEE